MWSAFVQDMAYRCLGNHRKFRQFFYAVFILIIIGICFFISFTPLESEFDFSIALEEGNETTAFSNGKCVLPVVDPFRQDVLKFTRKLPAIKCKGKRRGRVDGKTIKLDVTDLKRVEISYIRRPFGNDFDVLFSERQAVDISEKDSNGHVTIKPSSDFLKLYFTTNANEEEAELHNLVIPREDVVSKAEGIPSEIEDLGLNVAFVMLDSVSASTFRRVMPTSLEFLKRQEDTIFFKGHTIVGDGTTAQLCAMFTGFNIQELPEARRGFKKAETVDQWPFIFKNFKQNGYVTMLSEDEAAFNYRLLGFRDKPTDHYGRPFFILAQNENTKNDIKCYGNWPIHNYVLSYAKSFHKIYKNKRKFSVSAIARLPHNSIDMVQLMDEDLANFMKDYKSNGHFKNTMFVLFGDHGARVSEVRTHVEGKLEERLPHLSITLPHWFKKRHRHLYEAMRNNTKVLTSHFDIYATLKHILSYPNVTKERVGRSLFTPIDEETRNCKDAGVADHWCPCLGYVNISVTDEKVRKLAEISVQYINQKLDIVEESRSKCAKLSLKHVVRAGKKIFNWKMQNFALAEGNSKCESCLLKFKKMKIVPSVKYEIVLRVEPSDGLYEVTLNVNANKVDVDDDISRINIYGSQPNCIAKVYPHLRKYCFCK